MATMRLLCTFVLLPLLTVSGLTHQHDQQHVLDAASSSDTQSQSHVDVDVDMNIASEALTYQELEQQHTAQISQEVADLSTLQDQLQAEQDAKEQQRLWPFSKNELIKEVNPFLTRFNLKLDTLLMKEPTLIKATENPPRGFAHVTLNIVPYSLTELKQIEIIHDEWIRKLGDWFVWRGGYEFNWARMWEPVTKQYRSYVPSVKSQRCGTCWDFATSAMISSNLAVRYSIDRPIQWDDERVNPISLSEGELFECTGRSGIDDVCNGNWIQNAAARVISTGIAQNTDYQFAGALETNANRCRGNGCGPGCPVIPPATNAAPVVGCNFWPQTCPATSDRRRSSNPRFTINNLVSVYNTKDGSPWTGSFTNPLQQSQIRNLLRTKGPLGFYFRVEGGFGLNGNDVWPNNGAVYTTACTRPEINHAMVIVGYGRTSATDAQPNMDYWIVLNSWGNWSTDGFIKIRAGVNLCSAENIVFYPEFPKAYNDALDPCASQPTELERAQCFASLCDGTILSTSRYCKSRGRANFCKRVRTHNWCPNNNECCKCDQVIAPVTTFKSTDIKVNPNKLTSLSCAAKCAILRGGCSPVCRLYERVCRINIIIDTIKWRDYLIPLDNRLEEVKIRTIDQFAIAKLDGIKPIKTTLADAMKFNRLNQNEILVADRIIDPNLKQTQTNPIIDQNIKLANLKINQPV